MADLAVLGLSVDSREVADATRDLDRISAAAEKAERAAEVFGARMEDAARRASVANDNAARSANRATQAYDQWGKAAQIAGRMLGIVTAAISTGMIAQYADQWSELTARVNNAVGELGDGEAVLGRIGEMARRTYSDLGQTAEAWLSNATSLTAMGIPLEKQLDLVETLNNSLVVSATRGDRAASVQRAWSNAMALGTLRGDNLNSVLTNADRLAQALADSLGINVNQLREFGAAGRITREEMLAVTGQLEKLRQEADAMPATLADGMTLIRNALLETVGVFDQAGGVSERFASQLVAVADNIDVALKAVAATAFLLATRISGPLVASFISATFAATAKAAAQASLAIAMARASTGAAAQTAALIAHAAATRAATLAVSGLSFALAAVGGPAGAAILALGGVMYAAAQNAWEAQERAERYADAIRRAGEDSSGASGGIREAARALQEVEASATNAERAVSRAIVQADLAAFATEMAAKIAQLGTTMGWASIDIQRELQELRTQFFNSEMSVEDFISKIDDISKANPDASPVIAEIQRIARTAAAALGILDALNAAAAGVGQIAGGKESRVGNDPLSDFDFDQRWNAGWGDIGERLASSNAAMERAAKKATGSGDKKKGGKKGGAGDRANEYERLTEQIRKNIGALIDEAATIGMTTGEAAKYTATQDLLQAAMAAKIPVTEALREQIAGLAEEYAAAKLYAEGARLELELANDPLTRLQQEMQRLDEMLKVGAISWETYADAAIRANAGAAAAALGLAGQVTGALSQIFGDNKAFAIANAIISTAAGVAKAIEIYGPTPWGFAAAAAAAATGAAQIATIKSTNKGSGSVRSPSGGASSSGSSAQAPQQPRPQQAVTFNIHGEFFTRDMLEGIVRDLNDMQRDGVQLVFRSEG